MQKLKVLYLTNLIPSPASPVAGIFNYKRLEQLGRNFEDIHLKVIFPDSVIRKPFPYIHWKRSYDFSDLGLKPREIKVVRYVEYSSYGLDFLVNRVIEYRKEFSYDLIHVHWTYPFSFIACKVKEKTGVPYVVTCHGSDIHNLLLRKSRKRLILEGLHGADKVLFVSRYLLQFANKNGYDGDNHIVITNGFDPEVFRNEGRKKTFENDFPVVGHVSDFNPVKGGDLVPGIVNSIDSQLCGKVNFIFVMKSEKCIFPGRELCIEPERIKVYRAVPHEQMGEEIFSRLDLLLMPSRREGWPCTAIEALACGVMVLCSDIPPLREVVPEEFGKFVSFSPELDNMYETYAVKARELLNKTYNPAELQQYTSCFHWSAVVEKEVQAYMDVFK